MALLNDFINTLDVFDTSGSGTDSDSSLDMEYLCLFGGSDSASCFDFQQQSPYSLNPEMRNYFEKRRDFIGWRKRGSILCNQRHLLL